jgi:hypothetical protein
MVAYICLVDICCITDQLNIANDLLEPCPESVISDNFDVGIGVFG